MSMYEGVKNKKVYSILSARGSIAIYIPVCVYYILDEPSLK